MCYTTEVKCCRAAFLLKLADTMEEVCLYHIEVMLNKVATDDQSRQLCTNKISVMLVIYSRRLIMLKAECWMHRNRSRKCKLQCMKAINSPLILISTFMLTSQFISFTLYERTHGMVL